MIFFPHWCSDVLWDIVSLHALPVMMYYGRYFLLTLSCNNELRGMCPLKILMWWCISEDFYFLHSYVMKFLGDIYSLQHWALAMYLIRFQIHRKCFCLDVHLYDDVSYVLYNLVNANVFCLVFVLLISYWLLTSNGKIRWSVLLYWSVRLKIMNTNLTKMYRFICKWFPLMAILMGIMII